MVSIIADHYAGQGLPSATPGSTLGHDSCGYMAYCHARLGIVLGRHPRPRWPVSQSPLKTLVASFSVATPDPGGQLLNATGGMMRRHRSLNPRRHDPDHSLV